MIGKNAWKNFLGKGFVFRLGWVTRGYSYIHISWAVHIRSAHLILSLLFNHSVMSDSLWPHGLQHTRLPCPSPSPRAYSNSCPSSQWCHPTILSSVTPFSSCPQSFAASGSFPMNQLFTSGGQRIEASVLPMNIHGWFPLGLTDLISLLSKGLSRIFSNTWFESFSM